MSTNNDQGTMSLAEIMQQLNQLNEEGDASMLGGENSLAPNLDMGAEETPSLLLEQDEIVVDHEEPADEGEDKDGDDYNADQWADDKGEDKGDDYNADSWKDGDMGGDAVDQPAAEQGGDDFWEDKGLDEPAAEQGGDDYNADYNNDEEEEEEEKEEEEKEEEKKEENRQKEFTIVEEMPDVLDKDYDPDSVNNDGNDSEIDIAEDEEDIEDNNQDIELDLGSTDAQEDEDEEEIAPPPGEDEEFLRAALEAEALEAAEEPVAEPASFVDLEATVASENKEPELYIPELSEISQVSEIPRSVPIWQEPMELTAEEGSVAMSTYNEPSFAAPSVLEEVIVVQTPPTEIPTIIEPAVEPAVEALIEPAVEPEEIVVPGSVEALVLEQPVVLESAQPPVVQEVVQDVKEIQNLQEAIVEEKEDIVASQPEVTAEIKDEIQEKVEEIAEAKEEIQLLQEEIATAQAELPTDATPAAVETVAEVVEEKLEEVQEAQQVIAEAKADIVQMENLLTEQATIVAEPAPLPMPLPVVAKETPLRISQIFVPRAPAAIVAAPVATTATFENGDRAEKVQLLKFSVSETVNSGLNRASNIARRFNYQLGSNLIYVPTVENAQQMAQMFASIDGLTTAQLDQLLAVNLRAEQRQVYQDLRQIKGQKANLRAKKAQLDRFEEKVRRFQTLAYIPDKNVISMSHKPQLQQAPRRSNLNARLPAVSSPRLPGWVK